jgi:anti-sigma regulatory factor (Ser/Thr protein kinase)
VITIAEAIAAVGLYLLIDARAASVARAFTKERLGEVRLDAGHVDDVVRVVSELVANAVTHGAGSDGSRNVSLELGIWSKWTLVTVDDRDPKVYDSPEEYNPLPESCRGLLIVRVISERFWWNQKIFSKTANAVILPASTSGVRWPAPGSSFPARATPSSARRCSAAAAPPVSAVAVSQR